jgi:hypothetical protein
MPCSPRWTTVTSLLVCRRPGAPRPQGMPEPTCGWKCPTAQATRCPALTSWTACEMPGPAGVGGAGLVPKRGDGAWPRPPTSALGLGRLVDEAASPPCWPCGQRDHGDGRPVHARVLSRPDHARADRSGGCQGAWRWCATVGRLDARPVHAPAPGPDLVRARFAGDSRSSPPGKIC